MIGGGWHDVPFYLKHWANWPKDINATVNINATMKSSDNDLNWNTNRTVLLRSKDELMRFDLIILHDVVPLHLQHYVYICWKSFSCIASSTGHVLLPCNIQLLSSLMYTLAKCVYKYRPCSHPNECRTTLGNTGMQLEHTSWSWSLNSDELVSVVHHHYNTNNIYDCIAISTLN